MNLLTKTALLVIVVTVFRPGSALAQLTSIPGDSGAATEFQVTITQVEICDDSTCTNPTTLGSTSQAFDIASVSAGGGTVCNRWWHSGRSTSFPYSRNYEPGNYHYGFGFRHGPGDMYN